jgi:hypothetical protein
MALITLDPETIIEYIPKFERDNANSIDPLIVKLRYMPHKKYLDYLSAMTREMSTTSDPERQTRISKSHDRKMFCEHVIGFENWNKLDGTKEDDDPGAFYDRNDKELIYEIQSAIQDSGKLTEFQRKNLPAG